MPVAVLIRDVGVILAGRPDEVCLPVSHEDVRPAKRLEYLLHERVDRPSVVGVEERGSQRHPVNHLADDEQGLALVGGNAVYGVHARRGAVEDLPYLPLVVGQQRLPQREAGVLVVVHGGLGDAYAVLLPQVLDHALFRVVLLEDQVADKQGDIQREVAVGEGIGVEGGVVKGPPLLARGTLLVRAPLVHHLELDIVGDGD